MTFSSEQTNRPKTFSLDVSFRPQDFRIHHLDKGGVVTLSVGLRSGVRLWLARVMHSSNVLMKVAQVALSRDACRENECF